MYSKTLSAVAGSVLLLVPLATPFSVNAGRDAATQLALKNTPVGIKSQPQQFQLDPEWNVFAPRQTREFYWTIEESVGAPDGYKRQMLSVNGNFPGPLIEANMGDRIIVHVTNKLSEGTGIHWHGLDQFDTVFMDGLTGINQCPIGPDTTFTYNFTVDGQYGTYWWHSHYSVQYTDGIQGPLVVHSVDDPLKKTLHYDSDQVIMIDDWWHDNAESIANALLNNGTGGYLGHGIAAPSPDSTLINGVGAFNCPSDDACEAVSIPEIQVDAGFTHRLRFINSGSHSQQSFSVDGHPLRVIEADDTPVDGPVLHRVPIHDGQRYSVLLDTTKDQPGDAFWMRTYLNTNCFAWDASDLISSMKAIVRVTKNGTATNDRQPISIDWTDPTMPLTCIDIPTNELVPLKQQNVPQNVQQRANITFQFNLGIGRFQANGKTFINHPYDAVLYALFKGQDLSKSNVTLFSFDTLEAIDLIVNNGDGAIGLDHPIHLHGRSFWIVAEGNTTLTEAGLANVTYNTKNPLRRDVTVVPGGGYKILRLVTDDPGVWGMHCHIAWHLAEGFLGAIIIQPDEIRRLSPPDAWFKQCESGPATSVIPGIQHAETAAPAPPSWTAVPGWNPGKHQLDDEDKMWTLFEFLKAWW